MHRYEVSCSAGKEENESSILPFHIYVGTPFQNAPVHATLRRLLPLPQDGRSRLQTTLSISSIEHLPHHHHHGQRKQNNKQQSFTTTTTDTPARDDVPPPAEPIAAIRAAPAVAVPQAVDKGRP